MKRRRSKSLPDGSMKPLLHLFDGDAPVDPVRSRTMSKIRGKDTGPEMEVRRWLWSQGIRYRVHDRSLPGTPDISNKSRKVAVFIDGCFWHGCPRHYKTPKTRSGFWDEKIRRNREKRQRVRGQYPEDWTIVEFFECDAGQGARRAAEALRSG